MINFAELLKQRCLVGNIFIRVRNAGQYDKSYDLTRIPDELITEELLLKKGVDKKYLDYFVKTISFTDYRSTLIILTNNINDLN